MPRGLAIETSGRSGSAALSVDGVVLEESGFSHGLKHAAELIPTIDRLCQSQRWKPSDIEEIYVSVGPGSFTGLRVGITAAKTIAFATGAKLIAVPTVEVLARNAPPDAQNVLIVLDAKRDQIFTARLTREASTWQVSEPAHLDSLADMLPRSPKPVHLIGEGIPYHEKFLPTDRDGIIIADPSLWLARAAAVVEIGHSLARQNQFIEPDLLTPLYIRLPEAEEKFATRQSNHFSG